MSTKTAHPFVTLRNFSKKIFFFKKFFFSKFFDLDIKKWKKWFYCSIVLLFHGQRPKNLYLRDFSKKKFFSKFFFSKFFEIYFEIEEKYFYCSIVLLCHGQRPKNVYLRNFSKFYLSNARTKSEKWKGMAKLQAIFFWMIYFTLEIFRKIFFFKIFFFQICIC